MGLTGLSGESELYINQTDIEHRKALGQYFTPESLRRELLDRLPKLYRPFVCEPSAGTGEFVGSILEYFIEPKVEAFEIDENLARLTASKYPQIDVQCIDTLLVAVKNRYDLVIGNPPFFETKTTEKIKKRYSEVIHGRTNIYALFIKWALDAVKPGGYVSFIVPPSMNSGAQFKKLREHILNIATVEFVKLFDHNLFEDAEQNVQILILRKRQGDFVFSCSGANIFTPYKDELSNLYSQCYSIRDLGYKVSTGRIVWNQHKNILDRESGVFLVWSHNIVSGRIVENDKKPQYIRIPETEANKGQAIMVNRVTGCGPSAKMRAALIDGTWIAENHVNVIERNNGVEQLATLEHIKKELESPRVSEVIQKLSGNTQLSKTELELMIPIKAELE